MPLGRRLSTRHQGRYSAARPKRFRRHAETWMRSRARWRAMSGRLSQFYGPGCRTSSTDGWERNRATIITYFQDQALASGRSLADAEQHWIAYEAAVEAGNSELAASLAQQAMDWVDTTSQAATDAEVAWAESYTAQTVTSYRHDRRSDRQQRPAQGGRRSGHGGDAGVVDGNGDRDAAVDGGDGGQRHGVDHGHPGPYRDDHDGARWGSDGRRPCVRRTGHRGRQQLPRRRAGAGALHAQRVGLREPGRRQRRWGTHSPSSSRTPSICRDGR